VQHGSVRQRRESEKQSAPPRLVAEAEVRLHEAQLRRRGRHVVPQRCDGAHVAARQVVLGGARA
jgi:hypothetical protein